MIYAIIGKAPGNEMAEEKESYHTEAGDWENK